MQRSGNIFEFDDVELKMLCDVLKDCIKMIKTIIEYEGDFNNTLSTAVKNYREMLDVLED